VGVKFIPHSVFSLIEKDDDVVKIIKVNKVFYAKPIMSSHGMPTIGILNPPNPIKRRKCKPCTSTINPK